MKKNIKNISKKAYSFLDDLRSERGGKETVLPLSEYKFELSEVIRLVYITGGKGIIKFNKKEFAVKTNDIFFVFPQYEYLFLTYAEGKTEFYWCDMRGANINTFLEYISVSAFSPIIRGVCNSNIAREMRILKSAYTGLSLADYLNYKGCIYKICAMLINEFSISQWKKIGFSSDEIIYSGSWLPWPPGSKTKTGECYSSDENSFAELSFYGTGVKWYGVMNFDCGIADIIIDENYAVSVDTYSPERITGQILYSNNNLPEGNHVIKIVCTGRKNHLSQKSDIVIEEFQVNSNERDFMIDLKSVSHSLKKIVEYMESNYMKNENISDIAEKAGMSRSFFTTQFKKETGYSPKDYINRLKLFHAKEYLRNSDYSLIEISDLCGYGDVSYFMRVFKQREKMTATQYRNINRK